MTPILEGELSHSEAKTPLRPWRQSQGQKRRLQVVPTHLASSSADHSGSPTLSRDSKTPHLRGVGHAVRSASFPSPPPPPRALCQECVPRGHPQPRGASVEVAREQVLSSGQETPSSSPPNARTGLLPLVASADQVLGPAPAVPRAPRPSPRGSSCLGCPLLQALGTPSLTAGRATPVSGPCASARGRWLSLQALTAGPPCCSPDLASQLLGFPT